MESLENTQGVQNQIITKIGNVSASNDPKQIPVDATETLIKGAELAAAGKTLGMSEEETLAAVSRQYRRQSRADQNLSQRDVLRQMVQSQSTLTTGELKGIGYADTSDEDFAFGEDPYFNAENRKSGKTRASESQTYQEGDPQFAEQEQDRYRAELSSLDEEVNRSKKRGEKRDRRADSAERAELLTELERLGDARQRPASGTSASTSAMADALRALEAKRGGGDYSALNTDEINAADLAGRLEAATDPEVRRDNDRYEGSEAVRRSNRGLTEAEAKVKAQAQLRREFSGNDTFKSPIRSMPIDARAVREAEIIAELARPRTTPEQQLAVREGARREAERALIFNEQPGQNVREELASLGKGKTNFVTVNPEDVNRPQIQVDAQGNFVDERGAAVQDPFFDDGSLLPNEQAAVNETNRATSGNALNAPRDVASWIELNKPGYRASDSSFGNYPQVDVTQETTNFANKVRHLGQQLGMESLSNVSPNVRTTGELQAAVDAVIGGMAEKGKTFYMRNPETGKNEGVSNPGVAEVMQKLRMTSGDSQRLANAMFQMDAARRSGVNQNANQAYDARMTPGSDGGIGIRHPSNRARINYDSPEAVGGDLTPVAQAPFGSKVEGKDIRAQLAQLPSDGASTPYIGQVQGEKLRIDRFKPKNMGSGEELERNLRRQAISRVKPGEKLDRERMISNIRNAREVEDRQDQYESDRANKPATFTGAERGEQDRTFISENSGRIQSSAEDALRKRLSGGSPQGQPPSRAMAVSAVAQKPDGTSNSQEYTTPGAGNGGGYKGPVRRAITGIPDDPDGYGGSKSGGSEPDRSRSSAPDRSVSKAITDRLNNGIASRALQGQTMRRRIGQGAAIAGGISLAGKGLYDVTRPEEEETLMVRYS